MCVVYFYEMLVREIIVVSPTYLPGYINRLRNYAEKPYLLRGGGTYPLRPRCH